MRELPIPRIVVNPWQFLTRSILTPAHRLAVRVDEYSGSRGTVITEFAFLRFRPITISSVSLVLLMCLGKESGSERRLPLWPRARTLRRSCIRCCPDRLSPGREDGVPSRLRFRSPECRNHSLPDAPQALRDDRTPAPSRRRHPP